MMTHAFFFTCVVGSISKLDVCSVFSCIQPKGSFYIIKEWILQIPIGTFALIKGQQQEQVGTAYCSILSLIVESDKQTTL